jgi:lipid II:glycine glycyltransferase (peptidoglycan interpeptide bridge formation enzyme)
MIYYKKKSGIKMAEIWYNYEEKPDRKIDVLRYKYVAERKEKAASFEELWTLLIDLTKHEDELFSLIRKNTRYEINRAKNKDGVQCFTLLEKGGKNAEKLLQYIDFFNAFADSKNRSRINFSDIEQFYENKTFCARYAADGDGKILAMHAYIVSDGTARLYQSSSLFRNAANAEIRNMIGRANRLLHWNDILFFKNAGMRYYDFGGWYGGAASTGTYAEQLLINQFKESFGGEKKQEYSFIISSSFWGIIAAAFHSLLDAVKKTRRKHRNIIPNFK